MLGAAPMGDPLKILVQGYPLTLRIAEARQISVSLSAPEEPEESADVDEVGYNPNDHGEDPHPGLGEEGKYHSRKGERPLPKGETLTIAIAGQQNCGKTALFNALTGSNEHVGNFPGVTTERTDGAVRGCDNTVVTDLPGTYSLTPFAAKEFVTRKFILEDRPKGIINTVDAGNIERHLYLTVQLMELGIPMVLALNMMDELRNNGGAVRINEMERILGIPVVPITAARNEGVDELVEHVVHVAKYQERPMRQDFCDPDDHGGAVHRCLHSIMHLIEDHAQKAEIPVRFAASKIVEGDADIIKQLQLDQNELDMIEHIVTEMEQERGLDRSAAIADMRFSFIRKLCRQTVVKPRESKEYLRSKKMDTVLTGKWTAIPIFVLVMSMVIWLSIDVLGAPLQALLDNAIQGLGAMCGSAMAGWNVSPAIQSLVVDAIFGGVGCVVSFVPIIIILFFFLSLLEDSGYMARVAFVTDKLLRKIGLTGRSIVPLLIGFGCSVPAFMASRTLPSARDRKMTVLLTPFMSCSAKIPVYAFFTSMFFPRHGGLVLIGLYLLGIVLGIIVALVSKRIGHRSEAAPFVMELPNYRLPGFKNVGHLLWDKTKDFLERAFTVIFVATIVIWLLQTFNFRFEMVENGEGSMLAVIAGLIAPIFSPMGLGEWQIVTAFVSGFLAKESVVATLEVLGVGSMITTLTAVPMLVFTLIYTPCVAAISTVRKEQGTAMAIFVVVFQCLVAWVCALAAYWIAMLII